MINVADGVPVTVRVFSGMVKKHALVIDMESVERGGWQSAQDYFLNN